MRHEIEVGYTKKEIGLQTLNGNKFIGTITPQEAKFSVYRDGLGFPDFSNFDGVRFAFSGIPVEVLKLKTAINVDELFEIQNFEFTWKSTRQGKTHVDKIGCKIRGLRDPRRNPPQGHPTTMLNQPWIMEERAKNIWLQILSSKVVIGSSIHIYTWKNFIHISLTKCNYTFNYKDHWEPGLFACYDMLQHVTLITLLISIHMNMLSKPYFIDIE